MKACRGVGADSPSREYPITRVGCVHCFSLFFTGPNVGCPSPEETRKPMRSRGVRVLDVRNFNVFYTVDKTARRVTVIRVIYNRRNV